MLWLNLNQPECFDIDENQQFIFQQGSRVGLAAHHLFPNAELIPEDLPFMDKLSKTKTMVSQYKSIFEGSFKWDQCFCIVDALIYEDDGWHLIEVKSSTGIKSNHTHDIGFQFYILRQLGIPVVRCSICHINTNYVRSGELDYTQLFTMVDLTDDVFDEIPMIEKNIHEFLPIFKTDQIDMPIGPHCNSPYECSAIDYCWKNVPNYSVFDIGELSINDKFSFYYQDKVSINDFTPDDFSKFKQRQQIACEIEGIDFINREKLSKFLSSMFKPDFIFRF